MRSMHALFKAGSGTFSGFHGPAKPRLTDLDDHILRDIGHDHLITGRSAYRPAEYLR